MDEGGGYGFKYSFKYRGFYAWSSVLYHLELDNNRSSLQFMLFLLIFPFNYSL